MIGYYSNHLMKVLSGTLQQLASVKCIGKQRHKHRVDQ